MKPEHRDAEQPLRAWYAETRRAKWADPHDVKAWSRIASVIGGGRVVFNIVGNRYRLVVAVRYDIGIVYVRFVGTHARYDRINAKEV